MKKWIFGLVLALLITTIVPVPMDKVAAAPVASDDMRGIWVSYMDYAADDISVGL